jgi:hypothetical protein
MPTKEELERENAELRDRVAELEAGRPAAPRRPERPDFGLSAGEADDLKVRGVTTSPFNGEVLNALDEGIEPATPEARRAAEKAQHEKRVARVVLERATAAATPAAAE